MKRTLKIISISCMNTERGGKYSITTIRRFERKNAKDVKHHYEIDNRHDVIDMISTIANHNRVYMQLSVFPSMSIFINQKQ